MKKWMFLIGLFSSTLAHTQHLEVERLWVSAPKEIHTAVKNKMFYQLDSIRSDSSSRIQVTVAPDVMFAYQHKQFKTRSGAHLIVSGNVRSKLAVMGSYRMGYVNQSLTPYVSQVQAKAFSTNELKMGDYIYHDLRGRISYTPNKVITLQAGLDHLFVGEGDRSLFVGNQGIASPFAGLKVNFWKLEYHFNQLFLRERVANHFSPKASAMHFINFKPTKRWSIGIFESVVYAMKDTLYNRGFELEYLNPLIFYRPQEYNLGSSDNVLLGVNTSYQWKKNMVYGQLVIDDFFLTEIRARSRYWASKYGVQLGFKSWIDRANDRFFVRTEMNVVRPFTYSQVNVDNVYGNQSLALAHPLGSNFIEFYQEVSWQRNNWRVESWLQVYLKGLDSAGSNLSLGGDIYVPYNNRPEEYNFTIGRGITYRAMNIGILVARTLFKNTMEVFVEPRILVQNTEGDVSSRLFFTVGIHRNLGADRRNY